MDTIKHHLTDDLLLAYASGNLPEAFSLIVATHVSLCDECRAQLETFESVGGALIDSGAAEALAEDALEATLRVIESASKDPIRIAHSTTSDAVFPSPLQKYVGGDLSDVKWRSVPGGVKQSVLKTFGEGTVRLLSIPAGAEMPDHGHSGTELTLVLKGAFRDGGDRFGRGDVEVADEDTNHTPVAETGDVCICLAATDAPLRFRRFLPRMAQPFFGI